VVVNSEDAARALLDPHSRKLSERSSLYQGSTSVQIDDTQDIQRKLINDEFNDSAVTAYRPMILRKVKQLVLNLLDSPEHYHEHGHTMASSVLMSALYGYDIAGPDDPLVRIMEQSAAEAQAMPGKTAGSSLMLSSLPFLQRLKRWFVQILSDDEEPDKSFDAMDAPLRFVKQRMEKGFYPRSLVSESLTKVDKDGYGDQIIKEAAASAFATATGTITAAYRTFLLAMTLFPESQKRAMSEIDAFMNSTDKLPTIEERESLPYVSAILRETLRWHPTRPLGTPQVAIEDDVYGDIFVPKGSTIIPNHWAMSRDADVYPNPEHFQPERFLNSVGELFNANEDDSPLAFGWGERSCPGRHLAGEVLWTAIAMTLANFAVGQRSVVGFEPHWTKGAISSPLPFPCAIIPRADPDDIRQEMYSED